MTKVHQPRVFGVNVDLLRDYSHLHMSTVTGEVAARLGPGTLFVILNEFQGFFVYTDKVKFDRF